MPRICVIVATSSTTRGTALKAGRGFATGSGTPSSGRAYQIRDFLARNGALGYYVAPFAYAPAPGRRTGHPGGRVALGEADGRRWPETATELSGSVNTVNTDIRNIHVKL
jgi:hypothetical protein